MTAEKHEYFDIPEGEWDTLWDLMWRDKLLLPCAFTRRSMRGYPTLRPFLLGLKPKDPYHITPLVARDYFRQLFNVDYYDEIIGSLRGPEAKFTDREIAELLRARFTDKEVTELLKALRRLKVTV